MIFTMLHDALIDSYPQVQTLSVLKTERLRYVRYQNSSKTEIKTILLCLYGIEHSLRLVNDIRILPSYPHFTLIPAFYPHICILPSYPHFTLISAFYPHIRILPSYPSVRPSASAFYPNPGKHCVIGFI